MPITMCVIVKIRWIHCWCQASKPLILSKGRHQNGRCAKAHKTGKDCGLDHGGNYEEVKLWGWCEKHRRKATRERLRGKVPEEKSRALDDVVEDFLKNGGWV